MSAFEAASPHLSFSVLAASLLAGASCAKEAGSRTDVPQPDYAMQGGPMPAPGMPPQGAPPAQSWDGPAKRPKRVRDVVSTSGATTATGAPSSTTAPTPTTCMKIAQAYKTGAGVPADPLAGRRYALHACLECGSPGLAIVDQCPSWGIEGEPKKKTK